MRASTMLLDTDAGSACPRSLFHCCMLLQSIHLVLFHLHLCYPKSGCMPLAVHHPRVPAQSQWWLPKVLTLETYASSHITHATCTMSAWVIHEIPQQKLFRSRIPNPASRQTVQEDINCIDSEWGKIPPYFSKGKDFVFPYTFPLIKLWSTPII